jgi:hypothetical protein
MFWDRPEMANARREKEKRIPMHRFGEPHEVADLVLYLLAQRLVDQAAKQAGAER